MNDILIKFNIVKKSSRTMKQNPLNEFRVKFGGKPNEIKVHTLLKSLSSITTIIEEVNNEIGTGKKIDIKIKALEKGSFLVPIGLSEAEITLLSGLSLKAIEMIVKIIGQLFIVRKEIKQGDSNQIIEDGDNVQITTTSGNSITVYKQTFNIYNQNTKVNESLSETFQTLNDDTTIKSFELEDKKGKPIFEVARKDFEKMAVRNEINKPEQGIKIEKQYATIFALKLVFENKNRKWEFYYHGNKISALITDDNFYKSIDKGEQFGKGSALEVELQITKKFDITVNTYVITNYEVTKVNKHIPRSMNQGKIDFPQS